MKISIIVAIGKNREIGKEGQIPWHVKEDLQNFKKLTMNHHVVMGRKTFESIGKPLPGRKSIVLSTKTINIPGEYLIASSLEEAIEIARSSGENELFIAGGSSVYEKSLIFADSLYLSEIDYQGDADTYFPDYSSYDWKKIEETFHPATNVSPSWRYSILKKN